MRLYIPALVRVWLVPTFIHLVRYNLSVYGLLFHFFKGIVYFGCGQNRE